MQLLLYQAGRYAGGRLDAETRGSASGGGTAEELDAETRRRGGKTRRFGKGWEGEEKNWTARPGKNTGEETDCPLRVFLGVSATPRRVSRAIGQAGKVPESGPDDRPPELMTREKEIPLHLS